MQCFAWRSSANEIGTIARWYQSLLRVPRKTIPASRDCLNPLPPHSKAHGRRAYHEEASPRVLDHEPIIYRKRPEIAFEDPNAPDPTPKAQPRTLRIREVPAHSAVWRGRLRTWKDFEYESDFTKAPVRGPRLVSQFPEDWELWKELLAFQERHHGFNGIQQVWGKIQKMRFDLPTNGPVAAEVWSYFLRMTKDRDAFLLELLEYASAQRDRSGRIWPDLYLRVMQRQLRWGSNRALRWHQKLDVIVQLRREDYEKLFKQAQGLGKLNTFEEMYRDHPLQGLYSTIVPELCRLRNYDDALKWHFLLLEHKDLPTNLDDVIALFKRFKAIRNQGSYKILLQSVSGRTPQLLGPVAVNASRPLSSGAPSSLSDNMCARLFATRILPVEGIMNGLEMFGITHIEAAALREIVFRSRFDCQKMREYLKHMEVNGISTGASTYCRLIVDAVQTDQAWLLRSIVESDAHPETFDSPELQEKLLAMYWAQGDMMAVERTMVILLWGKSGTNAMVRRKNLLLRVHLRLKQDNEVRRMLDDMKANRNALSGSSAALLRSTYLKTRIAGQGLLRQHALQNVLFVIDAMRYSVSTGGTVPIEAWTELLRRLGMHGMLAEFRRLALWLADWYAESPSQRVTSVSIQRDLVQADKASEQEALTQLHALSESQVEETKPMFTDNVTETGGPRLARNARESDISLSFQPDNGSAQQAESKKGGQNLLEAGASEIASPLARLFTPLAQRAIIVWGFQQSIKQPSRMRRARQHDLDLQESDWAWGLKLVKDLRDIGVPVLDDLVMKQCNRQMAVLFGNRINLQKRNQNLRSWHDKKYASARIKDGQQSIYQMYARGMEAIWGKEVVPPTRRMPTTMRQWQPQPRKSSYRKSI